MQIPALSNITPHLASLTYYHHSPHFERDTTLQKNPSPCKSHHLIALQSSPHSHQPLRLASLTTLQQHSSPYSVTTLPPPPCLKISPPFNNNPWLASLITVPTPSSPYKPITLQKPFSPCKSHHPLRLESPASFIISSFCKSHHLACLASPIILIVMLLTTLRLAHNHFRNIINKMLVFNNLVLRVQ